jgi:hypothetical protein
MESLGEELLPLEATVGRKRKDANEKTEGTILNPASIPLALKPSLNTLMHDIFGYYIQTAIQRGGGRRKRPTNRRKRRRKQRRAYTRRR